MLTEACFTMTINGTHLGKQFTSNFRTLLIIESGQPQQVVREGMNSVNQGNLFPNNQAQSQGNLGVVPYNNGEPINAAVHENISAGAYASSSDPEQRYGWYFGGMARGNYSSFRFPLLDYDVVASSTFYQIDMSTSTMHASFTPLEWPQNQAARAEGGLVWLPFGRAGVLIALGGVVTPADIFSSKPAALPNNNTFMTDLAIYDIDGRTWYSQTTLESSPRPPQLAKFCTTVVPTKDGKSQEIFVYGGYDGSGNRSPPENDDVWVLSVPAFQWTLVKSAARDSNHGRSGPVCFSPNPTTLITVGGSLWNGGSLGSNTIIDVLNLTSLEWDGQYDPSSDAPFTAPSSIVQQLSWPNSDGPGNAQVNNLADSGLNALFSTVYPTQIKPNYPYASSQNSTDLNSPPSSQNKWKVPVIATLCTVIPVLLILAAIFFFMRRRRKNRKSVETTQSSRHNFSPWLRPSSYADPNAEKSNSSGRTAVESHSDIYSQPGHKRTSGEIYEAPTAVGTSANERYEIMDSSLNRDSVSIRQHPYYPTSITGNPMDSTRSEGRSDPSDPSEPVSSQPVSTPSEMPPNHGNLDGASLSQNDSRTNEAPAGMAPGSALAHRTTADRRISSPVPSPITPGAGHGRNPSEISNQMPVSPTDARDDFRSNRETDTVPSLPESTVTQPKPKGHERVSAYKESFDDT